MSADNPSLLQPIVLEAVVARAIQPPVNSGDGDHAPRRAVTGPPAKQPKAGRALRWPLLIVALLTTHAGLMVWAAVVASRDPAFVVRPNYYRDAVNWDKDRAAARSAVPAPAAETPGVKP